MEPFTLIEIRKQLTEIFFEFFRGAFTLTTYKLKLFPELAFEMKESRIFGIKLPKHLHPASYNYINIIAEKAANLLMENYLAGIIFDVFCFDQNFVRYMFNFSIPIGDIIPINSLEWNLDMIDWFKNQCGSLLTKLVYSEVPKSCLEVNPEFLKIKISFGLYDFKLEEREDKIFFSNDPDYDIFPWKVKIISDDPPDPEKDSMSKPFPKNQNLAEDSKPEGAEGNKFEKALSKEESETNTDELLDPQNPFKNLINEIEPKTGKNSIGILRGVAHCDILNGFILDISLIQYPLELINMQICSDKNQNSSSSYNIKMTKKICKKLKNSKLKIKINL